MRGKEISMPIDYSSLLNMCSDALESAKIWLAHEVIQDFIKYTILAIPFILVIVLGFKKIAVMIKEHLLEYLFKCLFN